MSSTPPFPAPVPEIPVSDIGAATIYYREQLGFELDWGVGEDELAGMSRDDCRIFLAGPAFRRVYGSVGPIMTWLNLGSKTEVDLLHREWTANRAILLSAPSSKPYGLHEFLAADPDGNMFRVFYDFATPERERGG